MIPSLLSVGGLLLGIGVVAVGHGLLTVFISVRLNLEGFSGPLIGTVVAAHSVGFLVGCVIASRIISRLGPVQSFGAFAALMAAATIAFAVAVEPLYWSALRFVTGFTIAGFFVITEGWLNLKIPAAYRGRVFSIYMTSNKIAHGGGQLLLAVADPMGLAHFMISAVCFVLCILPIAAMKGEAPSTAGAKGMSALALWRASPVAVVACLAAGINNTSVVGLGPVYAARIGLSTGEIAMFAAAIQFGNVLLQYPLGRLSDTVDRRHALIVAAGGTAMLAFVLTVWTSPLPGLLLLVAAIYGGLSFTLYPIALAHAADRVSQDQMVAMTSGLMLVWGIGSMIGPIFSSSAMEWWGPQGLFGTVTMGTLGLIVFTLWRIRRRPPPTTEGANGDRPA